MSIEQGLFKKQQVGRDGFYWWMGQVVPAKFWEENNPPCAVDKADELPGLKRRVKVRIFGYHTAALSDLTDEQLPWAYCMMPVTSGGSGGGMSQSVNLSGGEFVFGFFLDGEDGQQPIIMGVMDKSSQLTFPKEIPDIGFTPFQGYTNGVVESRDNMKKGGAKASINPDGKQVSSGAGTKIAQTVSDDSVTNENDESEIKSEGASIAYENAKITGGVKPAAGCVDDNPAAGIKLALERLQGMTSFVEKAQGVYVDPLTNAIGNVDKEMQRASENVAGYVKDIMAKVRAVSLKEAAEKAAQASIKLPIDKMEGFKDLLDEQLDGLGCAFENIIGGLENTLNGLLQDMMGKVTGALDCVINDVIGNMLDSALGALNQVMSSITGILDSLLGITDAIKLPVVEAGDFIGSLKTMFTCEGDSDCNDTAQTNLLNGNMPEAPSDFAGLVGGAMGLGGGLIPEPVGGILNAASDLRSSIEGVGGAFDALQNNVEAATQSIGNAVQTVGSLPGNLASGLQECNPFAGTCEPPLAVIFGGGVTEATANAIINQTGNIIGVDLDGSAVMDRIYNRPPKVHFGSNCGQGAGASGHVDSYPVTVGVGEDGDSTVTPFVPTIGKNIPDGYVVSKVVIDSPGTNYPPVADGSVGGSGNTFADADQTIIRDEDGNNIAINPERAVCFEAGSTVFIPAGGAVEFPEGTVDQRGVNASGYQQGRGLTDGDGFIVNQEYCIITPTPEKDENMEDPLSYDVVMELDELQVDKIGMSYNDGDTVTVEGDGNVLTCQLDLSVNGSIIGTTNCSGRGQGFTDIPTVTINTKTGAGGQITPTLRVKYRGKDNLDEVLESVTQDQIISVVDCVGKFSNG